MNDHLKTTESRLSTALSTFDRIEVEISTYSTQLREAAERERTLRERRASLDELSAAVGRRIAAESLLEQAQGDLEPARAALQAAEAAAARERTLAGMMAISFTSEQLETELKDGLSELESAANPILARLLGIQEKIEREQNAWSLAFADLDPALAPDDLLERGGQQNPPTILGKPVTPEGAAIAHPLARDQPNLTPRAWELFFTALGRVYGQRWRDAQAKLEGDQQARRVRLAALSTEGYDPYKP